MANKKWHQDKEVMSATTWMGATMDSGIKRKSLNRKPRITISFNLDEMRGLLLGHPSMALRTKLMRAQIILENQFRGYLRTRKASQ
jgi:hypothetical protein